MQEDLDFDFHHDFSNQRDNQNIAQPQPSRPLDMTDMATGSFDTYIEEDIIMPEDQDPTPQPQALPFYTEMVRRSQLHAMTDHTDSIQDIGSSENVPRDKGKVRFETPLQQPTILIVV